MSFTIWKSFRFEAAHHLTGLPEGHQCGRQHGHSYRVTLELSADHRPLTGPGFVVDFGDLKPVKIWLDSVFDHQDLNEVLSPWWEKAGMEEDTAPTSEHLAELIFRVISERHISVPLDVALALAAVKISETETSCAEYRP